MNNKLLAVDTKVLDESTNSISSRLQKITVSGGQAAERAKNFIIETVWLKLMVPLIVSIWILLAFVSFYKLKFSDKAEDQTKAINYLTWWTIGIVIMVSSVFIMFKLVSQSWIITENSGIWEAFNLYQNIIFPFVKLFMFIVVWILFIILLINVWKFILSTSDEIKKHAQTIIIWDIIWILIILWATNIVQLIYWKADQLVSNTNLWDIWAWIFKNKETVDIIYTFLNYFLSFVAFVVVVLIIYQWYLIVTHPEDEDIQKKFKRSFVYIAIWFIILVWWYLFLNFLIIK